jgi:carbamoyltransferase
MGIVEGHCSSAALMKDGEVIAVCFEERFSRLKNEFGYPVRAIEWCLEFAGIEPEELDLVALVTENLPFGQIATKREATFTVADYLKEQEHYWKPTLLEGRKVDYLELFKDKLRLHELPYQVDGKPMERTSFAEFKRIRMETVKRHLKKRDDQIRMINHHLAHSWYAIHSTPYCHEKPLLVLATDGYGDDCSASVGIYRDNEFRFVSKSVGSGIGRIYRYATLLLGMRPGVDEYKVMGLAPYAKEDHLRKVVEAMRIHLRVEGMEILYTNPDKDIFFSLKERLKAFRFDAVAAGLQRYCEEISRQWVRNCVRETGINDVVISGGVSMNVKINQELLELDEVASLFVGPSGGDETLSIGAAYAAWREWRPDARIVPLKDTYLGPEYSKADTRAALGDLPPGFRVIEDPTDEAVVDLLVRGKVVARSVGRMEFGARALGNRSILARADDARMIRRINDQVKNRDFWMPFAPLVMAERQHDYLVNPKNQPSPYMTLAFDSQPLARQHLAAALHPADDTMRAQILEASVNPPLHALLKEYERRTGMGGLLNTSFNLHGEPICCSPRDSIKTLTNSGIDALLLNGYLIQRRGTEEES